MLTEEQVQELIEKSLPSMINGMKAELRQSIDWQVKDQAAKIVGAAVQEWIKENIIPEIHAALVESKEGLVLLGLEFSKRAVAEIADAMANTLKTNLERSYKRSEIFKKMFE